MGSPGREWRTSTMKFCLGSHPNNLSLFILRHRGVIEPAARERGWQLEWFDYTQGARSGEWLADELVDVVGTGSTPPIAAQAAGRRSLISPARRRVITTALCSRCKVTTSPRSAISGWRACPVLSPIIFWRVCCKNITCAAPILPCWICRGRMRWMRCSMAILTAGWRSIPG